jgi:hypothetical protein
MEHELNIKFIFELLEYFEVTRGTTPKETLNCVHKRDLPTGPMIDMDDPEQIRALESLVETFDELRETQLEHDSIVTHGKCVSCCKIAPLCLGVLCRECSAKFEDLPDPKGNILLYEQMYGHVRWFQLNYKKLVKSEPKFKNRYFINLLT